MAIKRIKLQQFSLNRHLLIELKQIKELQHDNLVRFYGACLDPVYPMLVTEYCPRGSLQDILEEDEMKIDWNFKQSLMNDILKGLGYLHTTNQNYHGNLKSSNCVVDSRFVLKLTDFGLLAVRRKEEEEEIDCDSYEHYKSRLWTAPEFLSARSLNCGSKAGDLYSLAIILHEIVERRGVWALNFTSEEEEEYLEPKTILERLCCGSSLRPPITVSSMKEHLHLCGLITKCWAADPSARPSVETVRNLVSRIYTETSNNILDNLLSRMEQYADNLEQLVEERTQSYLEEKEKCENLLYELLPPSVADKLIHKVGIFFLKSEF